jgi:hypothetical protein
MTDESRPDIDRRLREAFACDPAAVRRVAAGADARSRRNAKGRRMAVAARVAALCVAPGAVLAIIMLLRPAQMPPPGTGPEPARVALPGTVTEGLRVVPLPDGSIAVTGGEARQGRPDDGYGIVLVEGELR